MVYILVWVFDFLMLGCLARWPRHGKAFCALAILFMGGLAAFRGAVGTDTQAYEAISSLVRQDGVFASGVEPIFGSVLHLFHLSGLGDVGVIRMIAVLDAALLMIYLSRSTDDERYFLLAVFLPAFFYAYVMNTLRIGLASIIFLLVGQRLAQRKTLDSGGLALMAMSGLTHYSAVVFPLFFLGVFKRWSRSLVLGGVGLCILGGLVVVVVSPGYVMTRLQAYDGFAAPSRFSGLSGVIQVAIMVLAAWKSDLPADLKTRLVTVSIALVAVFIGVTQFSYAGLRFLDLVIFICPVAILCAHGLNGVNMNSRVRSLMLMFGVVSAVFVFRRFLNEPPGGPAPFLPYHFLFE